MLMAPPDAYAYPGDVPAPYLEERLKTYTRAVSVLATFAFTLSTICAPLLAQAQTTSDSNTTSIVSTVVDVANGLPVTGAIVDLFQGDKQVAEAKTDAAGHATFAHQGPGIYHIEIRANDYVSNRSGDVVVNPGALEAAIRSPLERSSTSIGNLRQIGRVATNTASAGLQSTSAITQDISATRLQREDYVRVGDALNVLPGVNLTGQDSAVGDDLHLDIRGIGVSESTVMLDGHQIGPFGAGGAGFNLQLTPLWSLRNVNVIPGSAAQGLYGVDAIGGAIDLQTLNPTKTPQGTFIQGFGDQGKSESVLQSTGTIGKLGYAVSSSVQGTYGEFAPQQRLQPAFLTGTQDFSSAGIAAAGALYATSGNYLLRDNLAKFTYSFSPNTTLTYTFYEASSFDDKTGNGDNDSNPADFQLVTNTLPFINNFNGALIPITVGGVTSTPCAAPTSPNAASIPINTNSGIKCFNASQYNAATFGANGGGGDRQQEDRLVDNTLRLSHQVGNNAIAATLYTDAYQIDTTRSPKTQESAFNTFGLQLSDDITNERNDFGFGYYAPNQQEFTNDTVGGVLTPNPTLEQTTSNYFLRDSYNLNDQTTVFANGWFKHSSVTDGTTFDPRLSFVYHATTNDVVRFSAARVDNVPDIGLTAGAPSFSNPGSVNVTCNNLTGIGTVPSSNLVPEDAKDIELGFGHRFRDDSQVQVDLYDTNITNQIVGTAVPLSALPQFLNNPAFLAQLSGYISKLNTSCQGNTPVMTAAELSQIVSVSSSLNAAAGRYEGVEVSGRQRINHHVYLDYSYDIQSAKFEGLNTQTLLMAPNLINGTQITAIPLQKGSLGIDYASHGTEFRLDGFYVGNNNGYDRPAYTFFNGSITHAFKDTILDFGIQNLFNSATTQFGLIGDGVYTPFNPVFAAANAPVPTTGLANGNEEFGLAPRSFTFTVTQRVGNH
jgi:outer membrane receptor protein involved in Fe transport